MPLSFSVTKQMFCERKADIPLRCTQSMVDMLSENFEYCTQTGEIRNEIEPDL